MPLEDLVFKLGDSGIELNTDVSLPFVDIHRVYGLDSAPIRETERDHEGVDGGFMDAEFEKGRPMMMDGEVFADADTLENYLDQLKENWAPSVTALPFYLKAPGVDERVVFVKPRGVRYDWASDRRRGIARIQFVMYAEDPRIYTSTLVSVPINFGGSAGGGFGFPFGFPFGFGAAVPPNGANIINAGNRAAPAIFTIAGPVTDPVITNDTQGGATLRFSIVLGGADSLVIDLANKTVILNGSASRRGSLIDPDWFLLAPGDNFIRFGGVTGSGSLTVAYRHAWR